MSYLVDNLRMRMKAQNKSATMLSRQAGLNQTAVRDILSGRSRSPRANTLEKLAKALQCRAVDLMEPYTPSKSPLIAAVPIIGAVEAGVWKDAVSWPESDWIYTPIPIDDRFNGLSRFGLQVRGASMDQVYQEGDIVIVTPMIELQEMPVSGRRYVIYRHKDGEIEATLKEYFVDDDGVAWLLPKSNHPAHQAPIKLDDGDGKTDTVEIFARVTSVFKKEP